MHGEIQERYPTFYKCFGVYLESVHEYNKILRVLWRIDNVPSSQFLFFPDLES